MKFESFSLLIFLVLALVALSAVWRYLKFRKLRQQDHDWYKKAFPQSVAHGRVKCFRCNGSSIGTERLMQRTYLRRHVCRQCGTTLYYSPEN